MAQADQSVQNATFPTVRADINDNLAALFSDNSGATAPTVTVAYQDWIDTSGADAVWKKRNAANNAWITLGTISGGSIAFEGTLPSQTGNAGEYLTTDGTVASWGTVLSLGSIITASISVPSTSGTSIDFAGLPSWVKRITVMLSDVSTNGTSNIQIQVGSGSFLTSGYLGAGTNSAVGGANFTTGFGTNMSNTATAVLHGAVTISLITGNTWVASGALARSDSAIGGILAYRVTLSSTLDRIRITTVNGTDTFDAGSINILYEG